MTQQLHEVLSRLEKVTGRNNQYNALCPAHDDDMPSLRISVGREDQVMLKCLRGDPCSVEDIVKAMRLEMTDLFPPKEKREKKPSKKLTNTYKYFDAEGRLVMEVLRFVTDSGKKTFQQRCPSETGGWIYKLDGVEKPLYRLPQVLRAIEEGITIWVVEGEKDVETLEMLGYVATCNPGGAGGPGQAKWLPQHTASLAGAKVVLVTDNDDPGRLHVKGIKAELLAHGGIKVRVQAPPSEFKDVSNMVEKGKSPTEMEPFDVDAHVFAKDSLNDSDQNDRAFNNDTSTDLEAVDTDLFDRALDEFMAAADLIVTNDEMGAQQKADLIRRKSDALAMELSGEVIDRGVRVKWKPFLDEKKDLSYDWIIPNLLERQDRVIVVAAEGAGKTTLARQMAMMCSAGMHPFKPNQTMPPVRTLFYDLENPERIIRRATGRIYQRVKSMGLDENMKDNAHLVMKPDGLNLLQRPDQEIVEEHIAATRPDIVFFGPIYKSFLDPGGRTAESICTELVRFFDRMRVTYDCAMWMEHHAPLGSAGSRELRPFGSAVWSRWSEFGIAILPDPEDPELIQFNHYRGQREAREWPITCKRGATWPFEVVDFAHFDEHEYDDDTRTPDQIAASLADSHHDQQSMDEDPF